MHRRRFASAFASDWHIHASPGNTSRSSSSLTQAEIGIHIEGFVAQVVKDIPASVQLLDVAELRGVRPLEVRAIVATTLGASQFGYLGEVTARRDILRQRKEAIVAFTTAEHARGRLPFLPAA